jgi:hypothetical protein
MVASISLIHSALNAHLNQTLICYYSSPIFEFPQIFKGSINYLYVMILPFIPVTRHQHVHSFLRVYL